MRSKSLLRTFFIGLVLATGILVFAATRTAKTIGEDVCTEASDQCDKPKAHGGEFIILEALNRAVMTAAQ